MTSLYERSVALILENQAASGAYPASPTFPTYHYCWFRDGSFIAHAMDCVGEHESARRFFAWAADVINARAALIEGVLERARLRQPLGETLHTRYTLDGREAEAEWPNFQLDGFGTLLWAMGEHLVRSGSPAPRSWVKAAHLLAPYLSTLWRYPCFDCWEEFSEKVHPHTLAAIHAGLSTSQSILEQDFDPILREIRNFLLKTGVVDGHFIKYIGTDQVDASLLGLALPYRILPLEDPRIQKTVTLIDTTLRWRGGVHRYLADTYYGGGEWVLLSAWLGWIYALRAERAHALELKLWIELQADTAGQLPEQVPDKLNDPTMYQPWVDRWGEIARPLLWSHAMYLIMADALKNLPG
jgi:GH15 family glucan-1,4-alpha-glucosidase